MGSLVVFICLFSVSAGLSCEPCEKDICEIGPHNVKPTCYKVSKTVHITDPRLCVYGWIEKTKIRTSFEIEVLVHWGWFLLKLYVLCYYFYVIFLKNSQGCLFKKCCKAALMKNTDFLTSNIRVEFIRVLAENRCFFLNHGSPKELYPMLPIDMWCTIKNIHSHKLSFCYFFQ